MFCGVGGMSGKTDCITDSARPAPRNCFLQHSTVQLHHVEKAEEEQGRVSVRHTRQTDRPQPPLKMADSEFEEFRKYFDRLPQYIKAPADIYTLVHDVNELMTDGVEPLGSKSGQVLPEVDYSAESIAEPFSGDLQIIIPTDREERESLSTTRRRRKLPEIPKNARRWNEETRQISLAEEISDADKNVRTPSTSSFGGGGGIGIQQSQFTSLVAKSESCSGSRPIFILKLNSFNRGDDASSPDSELYPSLDSGNSTIHSDDGSKPYSPQILSVNESFSPGSPSLSGVPCTHLEILEATHRGLHRFVPRHHDEIEIDIGDAIYMQKEADDLWCEGVNLRTGMQGIFPSAYVVDVEYNDFDPMANKVKKERYLLSYVGSIETLYHKGNEVLCQAVKKISHNEGYVASHKRPCILEISDQGIHMLDKGKNSGPNHVPCHDYFYALKNVSFCGFHPKDHRYFGFVTKHPTLNRFACHVFISDDSTRPVAEAVGRAFQRFYKKFLETAYPIEDIYLE